MFLFVCGSNLKCLLCRTIVSSLKRLESNLDVMQDKQTWSRWAWVLCNCSKLTWMGYVDFSRSSGDMSSWGVKSGKKC